MFSVKNWSYSLKSLFLCRFWAEKSILPTTSWEESRSCTIMESLTQLCQMILRASSPSSSGSPICRRFVYLSEYAIKLPKKCSTDHQLYLLFSLQNKQSPVPVRAIKDPVDREIEYIPTKAPYDPRWMLAGRPHPSEYQVKIETLKVLYFTNQSH